ncbi:DUF1636 domain-containing protein [Stappia sp. WLB 29]|uniref:DUF1636 family protein n=1 Tax=Stappia sp. WLB 29 TaxID=2925220 RepID=UPI0020BD5280|nr:DUF1636 domain-containing protein [Stappia sp. WLB 29]
MAHDLALGERRMEATPDTRRHCITVCTTCRDPETRERPGADLIETLNAALAENGLAHVSVEGAACMAGCSRPCTVAYQAEGKASYLFGDIEPARDVATLVAFARQYAELEDGWCSSLQRPEGLKGKTLARMPALPAFAPGVPGRRDGA